jgi:integrase
VAVRPPKFGSERVVYVADELVRMLAEHVAANTPERAPDRWLFTAYGCPLHNNAITYRWRQTRRRAALEHVKMHSLRHYYASGLIAAGATW